MSGGHFDYIQYRLWDVIEGIKDAIYKHDKKPEWMSEEDWATFRFGSYSRRTLNEFEKAIRVINEAQVYIQRIDWLISGDDSEPTFHKRLEEDLEELRRGSPHADKLE